MSKKESKARERAKREHQRNKPEHRRNRPEQDGERSTFKAYYVTWTITGACFVLALVFYFEMLQAAASFSLDLGNSTGWGGIFGSIFGTIGAVSGIAGVYGEFVSIFLWTGIGMAIVSIILTIVQRPKEK